MNLFKRNLLAAMFLAVLTAPASVLAADAPDAALAPSEPTAAVPAAATPAEERMELMQTMRARMHEMMQTSDAAKRKELMEAQAKDMDTLAQMGPPGGMGMMMGMGGGMMGPGGKHDCKTGPGMGRGPGPGPGMGMGMMMGPGAKKPCHTCPGGSCPHHDGDATDQRLDTLEKRMDMMQMMMQMMLRR